MQVYNTSGTCSSRIYFEVNNGLVSNVRFIGGCPGNLQALSKLVEGRQVSEVVNLLKGIKCRNGTSCADQLATALEKYL